MARLAVENLVKRFGALEAVKGVSLSLQAGRSLALIGPTAAGKSVLLKCLAGLYAPEQGRILVDRAVVGVTDERPAELNARIGMLFQQNALFDSLPVWENIAFRLIANGMARDEARTKAEALLPRVGLPAANADLFPADLSGGMQKRVGLARAIAAEPEIIFFDEPTTGLDPIMAGVINELIREIVTEMGATAMTITHDMSSVRAIADNIAMLHDGVIKWTGPVAQLDTSGDPYLDQFIHGRAEGPIEAVR